MILDPLSEGVGILRGMTTTTPTSEVKHARESNPNCSWAHYGYLDGIRGLDPDGRLEGASDYDAGWLHGVQDRENPEKVAILETPRVKKGDRVQVPKGTQISTTSVAGQVVAGRTYQVTLHAVDLPTQASYYRGHFEPPKPARAIWVGSGGYWYETDAANLTPCPKDAP